MSKLLINKKACVHDSGRVEIYDYKLASKINKKLMHYDNGDYKFKEGDEALFQVAPNLLQSFISGFLTKRRVKIS